MTEYITANTPIPPFLPSPRFMLKMDVSNTPLTEERLAGQRGQDIYCLPHSGDSGNTG